jgi:hypothetical protein
MQKHCMKPHKTAKMRVQCIFKKNAHFSGTLVRGVYVYVCACVCVCCNWTKIAHKIGVAGCLFYCHFIYIRSFNLINLCAKRHSEFGHCQKKRVCREKLDDAGGSFWQQIYLMLLADRASAATACNPLSSSLFDSAQLAHKNHYSPWSEGKNTTLSALKCRRCKISSLFAAFMD